MILFNTLIETRGGPEVTVLDLTQEQWFLYFGVLA